jgi:hypothetical protein
MKPIKCLLLLAAALSFAINVAAMDDAGNAAVMLNPLAAFLRAVDERAGRILHDPNDYQVLEGEDGEACKVHGHMDYLQCLYCCIVASYNKSQDEPWEPQTWEPNRSVYEDYQGRCVCRRVPGAAAPTPQQYQNAKKAMNGEVIDPVAEGLINNIEI